MTVDEARIQLLGMACDYADGVMAAKVQAQLPLEQSADPTKYSQALYQYNAEWFQEVKIAYNGLVAAFNDRNPNEWPDVTLSTVAPAIAGSPTGPTMGPALPIGQGGLIQFVTALLPTLQTFGSQALPLISAINALVNPPASSPAPAPATH